MRVRVSSSFGIDETVRGEGNVRGLDGWVNGLIVLSFVRSGEWRMGSRGMYDCQWRCGGNRVKGKECFGNRWFSFSRDEWSIYLDLGEAARKLYGIRMYHLS